jgi:Cu-Zn family superoxide dismutase
MFDDRTQRVLALSIGVGSLRIGLGSIGAMLLAGLASCSSAARSDQGTTPGSTSSTEQTPDTAEERKTGVPRAEADLTSADGANIEGKATFVQEPDGVRVVLEVEDAPPGLKGVHVHQNGDCSNIKGESMGPHFAPNVDQHALPSEGDQRHLGDLGNIHVGPEGNGRLEIKVNNASLDENGTTSFLGRSLVVHSGQDSGSVTQPSGGSGAPMACGVIQGS